MRFLPAPLTTPRARLQAPPTYPRASRDHLRDTRDPLPDRRVMPSVPRLGRKVPALGLGDTGSLSAGQATSVFLSLAWSKKTERRGFWSDVPYPGDTRSVSQSLSPGALGVRHPFPECQVWGFGMAGRGLEHVGPGLGMRAPVPEQDRRWIGRLPRSAGAAPPVGEAHAPGGDQAAGLPASRGLRERRICMASLRESSAVPLPAILAKR